MENLEESINLKEAIGMALHRVREWSSKSQKEIADMLEINQQSWQSYECGKNVPNFLLIIRIQKELGISIDGLIDKVILTKAIHDQWAHIEKFMEKFMDYLNQGEHSSVDYPLLRYIPDNILMKSARELIFWDRIALFLHYFDKNRQLVHPFASQKEKYIWKIQEKIVGDKIEWILSTEYAFQDEWGSELHSIVLNKQNLDRHSKPLEILGTDGWKIQIALAKQQRLENRDFIVLALNKARYVANSKIASWMAGLSISKSSQVEHHLAILKHSNPLGWEVT